MNPENFWKNISDCAILLTTEEKKSYWKECKTCENTKSNKNGFFKLKRTYRIKKFFYTGLLPFCHHHLSILLFYYRTKQNKNKLKIQLLRTEQERNQSDLKRIEAEIQYLKEKEEKETIALARLNQRLEYFKQLNEITIPILMQNRNKAGALHLQENDWTIIRNNTNACFDHLQKD